MATLPLSSDAAVVYGLASTALLFAQSPDDEVERWLRPLRLYGESAAVLSALAIGEAPLTASKAPTERSVPRSPSEAVSAVATTAAALASERGMAAIGTVDLLAAVMREYPEAFERALQDRGSDTGELVEQLAHRLHTAVR